MLTDRNTLPTPAVPPAVKSPSPSRRVSQASSTAEDEPRWRGHLPALDGVRGLAIALVVISHVIIGASASRVIDRGVIEIARSGWIGVDLFFVLSGFLITGILLDSRDHPRYFRNFYIRRTLRIFPLYYGILAAVFVIAPLIAGVRDQAWFVLMRPHQWWFWTYSSNVLLAKSGGWGVTPILGGFWSLAVEEQFYLVWPVVVLLCSPRRLQKVCIGVIVGALAFRLAIRLGSMPNLGAYTLMPARADALAAGAWLAVSLRNGVRLSDIQRYAHWLLVATGLAISAIFIHHRRFWEMEFVVQTVGYTCLALGFAAVLCLCLDTPGRQTMFGRAFRIPLLRSLGKYSYAMYCFNPFVLKGLRHVGLSPNAFPQVDGSSIPGYLAFGTILFAITFTFSLLSWHLYEKHFLGLKDRFAGSTAKVREVNVPSTLVPASSIPGALSAHTRSLGDAGS